MEITSPAFEQDGTIPVKYTCQGEEVSPPLKISDVPTGAESLVLIMVDPDAVKPAGRIWNHWIIFNIPPDTSEINEGENPPGIQGRNTGNKIGYQGPCPPDGLHHYFFRLYALDIKLNLREGVSRDELEKTMKGHIIEECNLMAVYEKE